MHFREMQVLQYPKHKRLAVVKFIGFLMKACRENQARRRPPIMLFDLLWVPAGSRASCRERSNITRVISLLTLFWSARIMSHSAISTSLSNYNKHGKSSFWNALRQRHPLKNHTNNLLKTTSQFRIDVVADLNINNDYSSNLHHFFRLQSFMLLIWWLFRSFLYRSQCL